jgi:hypothetical protein
MEQFKEFVKQRIDVTEEELNDIVSRYQVRKIKKKDAEKEIQDLEKYQSIKIKLKKIAKRVEKFLKIIKVNQSLKNMLKNLDKHV